jgi:hypothetical protein
MTQLIHCANNYTGLVGYQYMPEGTSDLKLEAVYLMQLGPEFILTEDMADDTGVVTVSLFPFITSEDPHV